VAGHFRQTLGVARIITAAPPCHPLGSGRDATAGDGSAIFQMIELGQAETSGLRNRSGKWRGQQLGPVE
jgi:hypothetical protein